MPIDLMDHLRDPAPVTPSRRELDFARPAGISFEGRAGAMTLRAYRALGQASDSPIARYAVLIDAARRVSANTPSISDIATRAGVPVPALRRLLASPSTTPRPGTILMALQALHAAFSIAMDPTYVPTRRRRPTGRPKPVLANFPPRDNPAQASLMPRYVRATGLSISAVRYWGAVGVTPVSRWRRRAETALETVMLETLRVGRPEVIDNHMAYYRRIAIWLGFSEDDYWRIRGNAESQAA